MARTSARKDRKRRGKGHARTGQAPASPSHDELSMLDGDARIAREEILEAVENQIADGTSPETRETLERLLVLGYPREEARKYIACALTEQIFAALEYKRPYDEQKYIADLARLPTLPWE